MSEPERAVALAFALAVTSTLVGGLIRSGRVRVWAVGYWDEALPAYQRHTPFVFLPIGLVMWLGLLGVALEVSGAHGGAYLTLTAVVVFITVIPLLMLRLPRWLKPTWLIDEERRSAADPEYRARLVEAHQRRYSSSEYRKAWALLAIVVAVAFVLAWPPAVLIGLGVGGAMLYARRPRDM